MLLDKVPVEYKPAFRREGVFHEIDTLAIRTLVASKSKDGDKEKDPNAPESAAESATPTYMPISSALAATMPGYRKLTSLSIDPEDAITMRSRVIKFKYLSADAGGSSDDVCATLSRLVTCITNSNISEQDLLPSLAELASLFASADTSVSSFELLQSGVVDGLLQFLTDDQRTGKEYLVQLVPFCLAHTISSICHAEAGALLRSLRCAKDSKFSRWSKSLRGLRQEATGESYPHGKP